MPPRSFERGIDALSRGSGSWPRPTRSLSGVAVSLRRGHRCPPRGTCMGVNPSPHGARAPRARRSGPRHPLGRGHRCPVARVSVEVKTEGNGSRSLRQSFAQGIDALVPGARRDRTPSGPLASVTLVFREGHRCPFRAEATTARGRGGRARTSRPSRSTRARLLRGGHRCPLRRRRMTPGAAFAYRPSPEECSRCRSEGRATSARAIAP